VQVEPIKSKLNAPGTKRLKLKYDIMLSSFAFSFNLRRYTATGAAAAAAAGSWRAAAAAAARGETHHDARC